MRSPLSCLIGLLLLAACQPTPTASEQVSRTQAADRMVVMTYNIHHGEGTDGVFDLQRLADVILESNADLVALQEVDVMTKRAGGVDQASELARLTGMHHAFGRAIDYSGGQYGDAVLSKWPIKAVQIIPLPALPEHEDRVAVAVSVTSKQGQAMRFVSTHFDHTSDPGDRIRQAKHLNSQLRDKELPTLVLGDLNARPGSLPIKEMLTWLTPAAPDSLNTFPSQNADRKIDWILMSKNHNWQVRDVRTIAEPVASDHLPLVAELELLR